MIRTIVTSLVLISLSGGLSWSMVGYERGGRAYVTRHREQRKSLRVGSQRGVYYHGGPYSSRGPRFGK